MSRSYHVETNGVYVVDASVMRRTALVPRMKEIWSKYGSIINAEALKVGIAPSWVLSFIKTESNGEPSAVGSSGEVGLMQLTSPLWGGRSREQVFEPTTNIELGCAYIRYLYDTVGNDLPKIASGYNCGLGSDGQPKPQSVSPWNYCSWYGGSYKPGWYIDDIVAQSNEAILSLGLAGTPTGTPKGPGKAPKPNPGPMARSVPAPSAGGASLLLVDGVATLVYLGYKALK